MWNVDRGTGARSMLHRRVVIAAVFVGWAAGVPAAGTEVGFYFSGTVLSVFQDPFQAGITSNTPVSGRVLYDTNSPATDPISGCDCMGFRQHIVGGFTATFGDTVVRTDDYVVQVKNNLSQPGGLVLDTLSVRFSSFNPPLASPLWVNGSAYPTSWFQVNIDGPGDTFPDASLPQSLDLNHFTSLWNFLDDDTTDLQIGVVFRNTTLSALLVPPGDYNGDGNVDEQDFAKWQSTYGSSSILDADGNHNGIVDAGDYVVWRKHMGTTLTGSATPEPNTLLMLIFGAVMLGWSNGRH